MRQAAAWAKISRGGCQAKGSGHQLREMAAPAKLRNEVAHVRLGAARHERHLRGADDDPFHAEPCYHSPRPSRDGRGPVAKARIQPSNRPGCRVTFLNAAVESSGCPDGMPACWRAV